MVLWLCYVKQITELWFRLIFKSIPLTETEGNVFSQHKRYFYFAAHNELPIISNPTEVCVKTLAVPLNVSLCGRYHINTCDISSPE